MIIQDRKVKQKILCSIVIMIAVVLLSDSAVLARDAKEIEVLRDKIQSMTRQMKYMNRQMKNLQDKLKKFKKRQKVIEKENKEMAKDQKWNTEDISSLMDRVDKTEKHASKDRLNLSVQLEPRIWSTHMSDVRVVAPQAIHNLFQMQEKQGGGSEQADGQTGSEDGPNL